MNINLEQFVKDKEVTMPIVDGWGKYDGRKILLLHDKRVSDNWYRVFLGNNVHVVRVSTPLEIEIECKKFKAYRGYPIGDEIVPFNFQNLFRLGHGETIKCHFLQSSPWNIVSFILHPDGRFYAVSDDWGFDRSTIGKIQERFEKEEDTSSIKGLTPELRYYTILMLLYKQSYKELDVIEKLNLSKKEKDKRIKQFQNTFGERLKKTMKDSGGRLVRFSKKEKDKYLITWRSGNQLIKSVIKDDFRIVDLGYCASDSDKAHTLSSAVLLAKVFQRDNPLYLTRD